MPLLRRARSSPTSTTNASAAAPPRSRHFRTLMAYTTASNPFLSNECCLCRPAAPTLGLSPTTVIAAAVDTPPRSPPPPRERIGTCRSMGSLVRLMANAGG